MSGLKSKNSSVEGFVTVHSGSGSFFGFSVSPSMLPETPLFMVKRRRDRRNIARGGHVANSMGRDFKV